jgi:hypothetical protein
MKFGRQRSEVIQNHENENVRNNRKEARHKKYKKQKFGGDTASVGPF